MAKPAGAGAQIQQLVQSVLDVVTKQEQLIKKLTDQITVMKESLESTGATMVSIETRLGHIETSAKAAGTKRAVKPAADSSTTPAATEPTKKFPSSAYVWLGQKYRNEDAREEIKSTYFNNECLTQFTNVLADDAEYSKLNESTAKTTAERQKIVNSKVTREYAALWQIAKSNEKVLNLIQTDYKAEKDEYEKHNLTPATKDE